MTVIWHDLECGAYAEDLGLWRSLADQHGGPILDVGAGTGRVTVDLARRGHRVTALDHDPELLTELAHRAEGLEVETVLADARAFELERRFALCLVPMQTIQLLGGPGPRAGFLDCARRHLRAGAPLAIAISESLEPYEIPAGMPGPLPDLCERAGVVYSSLPTALRRTADGFVLQRRRETVTPSGQRSVEDDTIVLDRLTAEELEEEAAAAGLRPRGRTAVPETSDYAGSTVVMLSA
ncbi:MAG: class I SAM-dependent methyltransferase [Solirubrobacterales bacterium]|nr:class I SAM-dependent methyltransferase [Solirubrobacterales bacterium]MBV9715855.1 class I SAM-dependent methyltransferase [Solirubrobacterales bacterium]